MQGSNIVAFKKTFAPGGRRKKKKATCSSNTKMGLPKSTTPQPGCRFLPEDQDMAVLAERINESPRNPLLCFPI